MVLSRQRPDQPAASPPQNPESPITKLDHNMSIISIGGGLEICVWQSDTDSIPYSFSFATKDGNLITDAAYRGTLRESVLETLMCLLVGGRLPLPIDYQPGSPMSALALLGSSSIPLPVGFRPRDFNSHPNGDYTVRITDDPRFIRVELIKPCALPVCFLEVVRGPKRLHSTAGTWIGRTYNGRTTLPNQRQCPIEALALTLQLLTEVQAN